MTVAIIDYGMGNLRSVQKAFEKVAVPAIITRDAGEILQASRVVLPGVGAFADCMKNLKKYGLVYPILDTISAGKPFLGICLGLQVLFEESEEFGRHEGLGVLPGKVVRFKLPKKFKVPHMGWNRISKKRGVPLLADVDETAYFYFVHSYYVVPKEKQLVATTTDYGADFTSAVARNNIFACQFHPEKSQTEGLKILKAFGTTEKL